MRIELWSIYFSPVPLGIGPVAGTVARELAERGNQVTVVSSHPHYPTPEWGVSWRPRRCSWEGVDLVELPVYPRRQNAIQRAGEEFTYGFMQTAWSLRRRPADVIVATVPSLLCLPGAVIQERLYGTPWVIWLQDVVSTAAATTGLAGGSRLSPILARIERAAFRRAERSIVISEAFKRQLLALGVPEDRIEKIYLGAGREIGRLDSRTDGGPPVVLVIGNIGLTQNLPAFIRAFQDSSALQALGAELRITGGGVQAAECKAVIASERVSYLGLVSDEELERELSRATVGLVSQGPGVTEFNLPSKAVTYMASALPVFGVVDPQTEIGRMIVESGSGDVSPNDDLESACMALTRFLSSPSKLETAADAALKFARENFEPKAMAGRFEHVLRDAVMGREPVMSK